jgi:hypothetical protein
MTLTYLPLLQVQRDLYNLPRGMERFNAYIETMVDPSTRDLKLPLVAMNPMGKDHVPALLDGWMALQADEIASQAVAQVSSTLAHVSGSFRVTLVISDDLKGGWTNRYFSEFSHRFETRAYHRRGWVTGILWTSESPAAEAARQAALTSVYRAAHIEQHGYARTLREMLGQEGYAMSAAGCTAPSLDAEDLVYTREVMAQYLDATDQPTVMACLYGDEVARALGYAPLGFTERAGLALALDNARAR